MFRTVRAARVAAAALFVAGALAVAGCGGGSINTTPVPTPAPSVTTTQTLPTAGGTLSLPAASNGQVATLAVAAGAPAGVTVTASTSVTAPANAPAPSSIARTTSSTTRSAQAVSGAIPFFYATFSVSANVQAQYVSFGSVTLLTTDPPTASYYVEVDDLSAAPVTKLYTNGPATLASGTATFAALTGTAALSTLTAGHTYLAQVYYVPAAGASPTATATATATASASPSATATPTASPSPTASPVPTATATASPTPTATPTALATYTLTRDNSTIMCTATCQGLVPITTAAGGALSFTFGAPTVTPGVNINATEADSTSQITPAGFPAYTGAGTIQMYFALQAPSSESFTASPGMNYEFPSTTSATSCTVYNYALTTGGYAWGSTATASVSSNAVTFAAQTGTFTVGTTPLYYVLACS